MQWGKRYYKEWIGNIEENKIIIYQPTKRATYNGMQAKISQNRGTKKV